jgi:hypothetical protein
MCSGGKSQKQRTTLFCLYNCWSDQQNYKNTKMFEGFCSHENFLAHSYFQGCDQ